MRYRKRISRRRSKKLFRRTARRTHAKNRVRAVARGGIRF